MWSPCIKVCFVDPESQICVGCFRTMEELACWTRYTDDERDAIGRELDGRKAEYARRREARGSR